MWRSQVLFLPCTFRSNLAEEPPCFHELDAVAGSWQEDKGFDAALAAQDLSDFEHTICLLHIEPNHFGSVE